MTLEATGLLTQDAEPSGTTLINARNGFNELIRLVILWKVHYCSLLGTRFAFNCNRNWEQIFSVSTVTHQSFY